MRFNRYPDKSSAALLQRDCAHDQLKMGKFFGKSMLGCQRCELLWEVEDVSFVDQKLSEVQQVFEQRNASGDDSLYLRMDVDRLTPVQ